MNATCNFEKSQNDAVHLMILSLVKSVSENVLQFIDLEGCMRSGLRFCMAFALDVLEVQLESPHFVHEISNSILAYVLV